uniref:Ovule protein n=1 Tax=Steinernema glaseri TaxID=37863 RepID=A0A1I7YIW9_9BILA
MIQKNTKHIAQFICSAKPQWMLYYTYVSPIRTYDVSLFIRVTLITVRITAFSVGRDYSGNVTNSEKNEAVLTY